VVGQFLVHLLLVLGVGLLDDFLVDAFLLGREFGDFLLVFLKFVQIGLDPVFYFVHGVFVGLYVALELGDLHVQVALGVGDQMQRDAFVFVVLQILLLGAFLRNLLVQLRYAFEEFTLDFTELLVFVFNFALSLTFAVHHFVDFVLGVEHVVGGLLVGLGAADDFVVDLVFLFAEVAVVCVDALLGAVGFVLELLAVLLALFDVQVERLDVVGQFGLLGLRLLDLALQVDFALLLLEFELDHVFVEGLAVGELEAHELFAFLLSLLKQLVFVFSQLDLLLQVADLLLFDAGGLGFLPDPLVFNAEAVHLSVKRKVEVFLFRY